MKKPTREQVQRQIQEACEQHLQKFVGAPFTAETTRTFAEQLRAEIGSMGLLGGGNPMIETTGGMKGLPTEWRNRSRSNRHGSFGRESGVEGSNQEDR